LDLCIIEASRVVGGFGTYLCRGEGSETGRKLKNKEEGKGE
jgi:hypothetical protein